MIKAVEAKVFNLMTKISNYLNDYEITKNTP